MVFADPRRSGDLELGCSSDWGSQLYRCEQGGRVTDSRKPPALLPQAFWSHTDSSTGLTQLHVQGQGCLGDSAQGHRWLFLIAIWALTTDSIRYCSAADMNLVRKWTSNTLSLALNMSWASVIAQLVKNPPAMQETPVGFLGWDDPLEKG